MDRDWKSNARKDEYDWKFQRARTPSEPLRDGDFWRKRRSDQAQADSGVMQFGERQAALAAIRGNRLLLQFDDNGRVSSAAHQGHQRVRTRADRYSSLGLVSRTNLLRAGRFPGFSGVRKTPGTNCSGRKNPLHARKPILLPGSVSEVFCARGQATGPGRTYAGRRRQMGSRHRGKTLRKRFAFGETVEPRPQADSR